MLGVGFVAGTFSLRAMMSNTFSTIVNTGITADAYVRPPTLEDAETFGAGFISTRVEVPFAYIADIEALADVEMALPQLNDQMVLVGADGTAAGAFGPPTLGIAFDERAPAWRLLDGRAPTSSSEVMLEVSSAQNAGLDVGDQTKVVVGEGVYDVEVVGIAETDAPMSGATIVLIDYLTAAEWFDAGDQVGAIAVYGSGAVTEEEVAEQVREVVGDDVEVVTGTAQRDEMNEAINEILGFIGVFLLIFAVIALFVGAFIIANTFTMTLRERAREFALLRAVGASPTQVFVSILLQAVVVGLVGSALGIGVGVGLVAALRLGLEQFGATLAGDLPLDAPTVAISVGTGLLVCVVGAALPARRAALTPPLDAMRAEEPTGERSLTARGIIGVVVLVAGLGAVTAASLHAFPDYDGPLLALGAGAVLIGALAAAPVVSALVLRILAVPAVVLLRPIGRLARGNVVRYPRRTANTAGALMIGMALVGVSATLAASTNASTADLLEEEVDAELVLASGMFPMPPVFLDEVRDVPGVERVDLVSMGIVSVDGAMKFLSGQPVEMFNSSIRAVVTAGSLAELGPGTIALEEGQAGKRTVGETITVVADAGPIELEVVALVSIKSIQAYGYVTEETMAEITSEAAPIFAVVDVAADRLDRAVEDIRELAEPYYVIQVLDGDELTSFLGEQVDQMLIMMYALLGLSVVIAVLGIINTLALSVMERTREIGLLRVVGMSRAQTAGTIAIEAVLIAVFGTLLGLSVGVGLAVGIQRVFEELGLSSLVIPWGQLLVMVAGSGLVGLIASVWPAIRAARLPVLEAVTVD